MKIGNIKEVMTEEFLDKCRALALKFKRGNRTFEQVFNNTCRGYAVEELVNRYLGLEESGLIVYDSIDPKTKEKYEIKHTTQLQDFWTYNINTYKFFLKNINKIDYLVFCYVDTLEGKGFGDVYIQCIADCDTFLKYSVIDKTTNRAYYDKVRAMKDDACILY